MVRLGMNSDRSIVLTGFPITPDRRRLLGYRQGMLYDGIPAERAHVSIAGRSTASIIDAKKHYSASEAAFSQVFQLGEAAA